MHFSLSNVSILNLYLFIHLIDIFDEISRIGPFILFGFANLVILALPLLVLKFDPDPEYK